jgi:diacylglycerol kinase
MVKDFNLRRLPASFRYATRGIWYVLRTEQNIQIHFVATAIVIALGMIYHISALEFAVLLLAIGFVIAAEVLNTVIEDFLDVIHPTHHHAVRRIKDSLAGAVLLAAMISVGIGLLIFIPRIVAGIPPNGL